MVRRLPGRQGLTARLMNWATVLLPFALVAVACTIVEPVAAWLYDTLHGGALPLMDYFEALD